MKLRVVCSSCWTVLRAPCAGVCMSCVAERQIILSSTTCLITANIVEIVRYPTNTVYWLFTSGSTINNHYFWHSNWHHYRLGIEDKCVVADGSMLYSLLRFCLVHTVDSSASKGWFSCDQLDQVIIWMCFECLLATQQSAFR